MDFWTPPCFLNLKKSNRRAPNPSKFAPICTRHPKKTKTNMCKFAPPRPRLFRFLNFRIIIRGVPSQRGTEPGLDTYQICIQARFDTYQIHFLIKKIQRKTLKTCTEHSVALDARDERKLAVPPFRLFRPNSLQTYTISHPSCKTPQQRTHWQREVQIGVGLVRAEATSTLKFGRPSMEAFLGHPREPLSGY